MRGLLQKDFYIAKANMLIMAIGLIVIGFGMSFLMEIGTILVIAPPIFTTAVFISISVDATSKWERLAITMPISREDIILSKFLSYIILSIFGIVVGVIPCIIIGWFQGSFISLSSLLLYGFLGLSASFIAGCFSLPLAFIFDAEKAQIVFMVSFIAASGIITGAILFINLFIPVKEHMTFSSFAVFVFSMLLFYISFAVSKRMYNTKDI